MEDNAIWLSGIKVFKLKYKPMFKVTIKKVIKIINIRTKRSKINDAMP